MIMKSLIENIKYETNSPRNDNMLHFSTHLQHDRHTAIYTQHGYPEDTWDRPWMNTLPLFQGTAIHEELHRIMEDKYPLYDAEVPVMGSKKFKYVWTGTADAYILDEDDVFWLIDYKTISGASFEYLDGAKPEHVLQISAYYHFHEHPDYGKPDKCAILYLPTTPDYRRRWPEPLLVEVTPLPKDDLKARMIQVEYAIDVYAATNDLPQPPKGEYKWKKNKKEDHWELWWYPHYSSLFCPWKGQEEDPCGCSKFSRYVVGTWSARTGVDYGEDSDGQILEAHLPLCPEYEAE